MENNMMDEERMCTKCGEQPRTLGQRWCQPCKSARQREARHMRRLKALVPPPSTSVKNAAPAQSVCEIPLKNRSPLGIGANSSAPSVSVKDGVSVGVSNQEAGRLVSSETITPATPVKNALDSPGKPGSPLLVRPSH